MQKISCQIKYYDYTDTPIGPLLLAGCVDFLQLVGFSQGAHKQKPDKNWQRNEARFEQEKLQLEEYFSGQRKIFDIKIKYNGTEFQKSAWTALQKIPYGQTRTYGEQAKMIGRPKAVRAIGGANNANPIPIIIPCHRVIGANGSMTGFGGGIKTKQFLLALEGAVQGGFIIP